MAKILSAFILVLCFGLAGPSAIAFPSPYTATVDVMPWVPSPQDHAILSITDTICGCFPNSPSRLESLQVSRQGNDIDVTATLVVDYTTGNVVASFQLDLGVLSPGRYSVHYTQAPPTPNPGAHDVTISFSVSVDGYATAVEYFAPSLGHFFITSDSNEIAGLDNGVIPGWVRTGESFHVIPPATQPSTAASICRLYGLPQAGLNSHVFALEPECDAIQKKWPSIWILERMDAFAVPAQGTQGETCANGSIPLYRLYNKRADANHRFTTSKLIRDQMIGLGWILEGTGSTADTIKVMCVLQ